MTSYYFETNEEDTENYFSGSDVKVNGEFKTLVDHISVYLAEQWNYPFIAFCDLAEMTPSEFKEAFQDLTPEGVEELIDETINFGIYSAQRGYAATLAEHNRSV